MPGNFARLAGLFLLLLLLPRAGTAITIDAARVWPGQDYTRLTLESAKPIGFNMFTLSNPDRVVIDLNDVELHGALDGIANKIGNDDPYIKSVRVAQHKPGVVRLVLDVKVAAKPQLFSLNPVAQYGHRLVLDVYPVVPADPLMALVNEAEKKLPPDAASLPPRAASSAAAASAPAETRNQPASAAQPAPANVLAAAPPPAKPGVPAPPPGGSSQAKGHNEPGSRMLIIVIDAGHGGEDPGAHGRHGTLEKHVTLAIARRLKKLVDETGNMRAVLTRDGDYFIELGNRVVKARNAHADLFVSIHADSFIKPKASGSSVFALSDHGATSAAARWLAKHENEADLIGGVNINVKDPYLAKTLLDLSQTATISDSLKLGDHVLKELRGVNTLHHHHVEQAGFAVLKAPDIPSILVETAFISNPKEELKLKDDAYQDKLAHAILGGIKRYFAQNPALARQTVAQTE
ncbi:MAG TPA: N-acetylmuramoyl-L-alanine amidase [Gallionellaceae bacterium]